MKRYKLTKIRLKPDDNSDGGFIFVGEEAHNLLTKIYDTLGLKEDPQGEWVRYEDIKSECNCNEEIERRSTVSYAERAASCTHNPLHTWWVCPAHGYKKR